MVNRLYLTNNWTSSRWAGSGDSLINNIPATLSAQASGSISYVDPGDTITLGDATTTSPTPGGTGDDGGHTAIVSAMSGNTLTFISQNAQLSSTATLTSGSLSAGNATFSTTGGWYTLGFYIQAIVHQPPAIAYVDTSGDVLIKTGQPGTASFTNIWSSSTLPAASTVEVSPNRIAILTTSGELWVNQLPITQAWQEESTGVSTSPGNYQITDDNVAVLLSGGVYIKPGTGWTTLNSGGWESGGPAVTSAMSFQESENDNIAAELSDDYVYVAWGGYGSSWTKVANSLVANSPLSYSIANNYTGVVLSNNELYIMVGSPTIPGNNWNGALSSAATIQFSADGNIGAEDTSGDFDVDWGGYGSSWTGSVVSPGYLQAEVSNSQVAQITSGNELYLKEGTATGSWVTNVATNGDESAIGY